MVSFGLKWNSYQDGNGLAVQISSDKWKATLVCQGVKVFVDGAKKRTERTVGLGWGGGNWGKMIRDSYFPKFRFGFVVGKLSVMFPAPH